MYKFLNRLTLVLLILMLYVFGYLASGINGFITATAIIVAIYFYMQKELYSIILSTTKIKNELELKNNENEYIKRLSKIYSVDIRSHAISKIDTDLSPIEYAATNKIYIGKLYIFSTDPYAVYEGISPSSISKVVPRIPSSILLVPILNADLDKYKSRLGVKNYIKFLWNLEKKICLKK